MAEPISSEGWVARGNGSCVMWRQTAAERLSQPSSGDWSPSSIQGCCHIHTWELHCTTQRVKQSDNNRTEKDNQGKMQRDVLLLLVRKHDEGTFKGITVNCVVAFIIRVQSESTCHTLDFQGRNATCIRCCGFTARCVKGADPPAFSSAVRLPLKV